MTGLVLALLAAANTYMALHGGEVWELNAAAVVLLFYIVLEEIRINRR